jgi:hypothetical protein
LTAVAVTEPSKRKNTRHGLTLLACAFLVSLVAIAALGICSLQLSEAISAQQSESSINQQNFTFLKNELFSTGNLFFLEVDCAYFSNPATETFAPCGSSYKMEQSPFQFNMANNPSAGYVDLTDYFLTYMYSGQSASVSFNSTLPLVFEINFEPGPPPTSLNPSMFYSMPLDASGTIMLNITASSYEGVISVPQDGLYSFIFATQSTLQHPATSVSFYAKYNSTSPL